MPVNALDRAYNAVNTCMKRAAVPSENAGQMHRNAGCSTEHAANSSSSRAIHSSECVDVGLEMRRGRHFGWRNTGVSAPRTLPFSHPEPGDSAVLVTRTARPGPHNHTKNVRTNGTTFVQAVRMGIEEP